MSEEVGTHRSFASRLPRSAHPYLTLQLVVICSRVSRSNPDRRDGVTKCVVVVSRLFAKVMITKVVLEL